MTPMGLGDARKPGQRRTTFREELSRERETGHHRSTKAVTGSTLTTAKRFNSFRCGKPGHDGMSAGRRSLLELYLGRRQVRRHGLRNCHQMAEKWQYLEGALVIRRHR